MSTRFSNGFASVRDGVSLGLAWPSAAVRIIVAVVIAALIAVALPFQEAWAVDGEGEESVQVSEDESSAYCEEVPFGLTNFSRAQKGSESPIDGVQYGYHFISGSDDSKVVVIALKGKAVVYVPPRIAEEADFNLDDSADQRALQSLTQALDQVNANGGQLIEGDAEWLFTSKDAFEVDGIAFGFHRELKDGYYYETIEGLDSNGQANPNVDASQVVGHACFANLEPAERVASGSQAGEGSSFLEELDLSPLWVTLKTSLTSIVIVFVLGLAAAYASLRMRPRVRDLLDSVLTIPMVLPPTVCGFLLLLLLGRNTFIGSWFISVGFPLVFSWAATVVAASVVSFPIMYRSARAAFESVDSDILDAARTLGWGNARIFFKLMLPLSYAGIAGGAVLAFARGLGEFGATLFLAGNYIGVTRTIPIAIYFEWMNGNTDAALFWTGVILVFSLAVILLINLQGRKGMQRGAERRGR